MHRSKSSSHKYEVRQTQRDVNVTQRDLELFRELNHDEAKIREMAQTIKVSYVELRDYPNDVAVILHTKSEQFASIKRNVNTITSVGNTISLLTLGGKSQVVAFLNLLRDNNAEIAKLFFPYFEPSLALTTETEGKEDKVIVVSNNRTAKISDILQKFSVPEGIAVDLQDIYNKGPDAENITSIFSHIFTKFAVKETKPDNSNFDL